MEDVYGMDDLDMVLLTGTIVGNPDMQDNIPNGRVALNFVVECQKTIQGKPMFFRHQITAWDKVVEKYKDKIVNGPFVRIEGHLQASTLNYIDAQGNPRVHYSDRVNAKHMVFVN